MTRLGSGDESIASKAVIPGADDSQPLTEVADATRCAPNNPRCWIAIWPTS
jgi:hypothetical protein